MVDLAVQKINVNTYQEPSEVAALVEGELKRMVRRQRNGSSSAAIRPRDMRLKFFERPEWKQLDVTPAPGPEETEHEIDALLKKQDDYCERQRRSDEIRLEEHDILFSFRRYLMLAPTGPRASTFLLTELMLSVGAIIAVHYKNKFVRQRPVQLGPRLRPLVDVPDCPSYPSGHALQAFLIAHTLASVIQDTRRSEETFDIAARVSENREWAGLNYASDTVAGARIASAILPIVKDTYEELFEGAAREWVQQPKSDLECGDGY